MAAALKGVLLDHLAENVKNSKILVVGAGGIGCEVLKNLVLTGFHTIEVVTRFCSFEIHGILPYVFVKFHSWSK
jgi:molybdopterin/thiamine biosynthesis adenylyltransferase